MSSPPTATVELLCNGEWKPINFKDLDFDHVIAEEPSDDYHRKFAATGLKTVKLVQHDCDWVWRWRIGNTYSIRANGVEMRLFCTDRSETVGWFDVVGRDV